MKRYLKLQIVSFLLLGFPAYADFEKGKTAFDRGDFVTSFYELKPLADQGSAQAQYYVGWMYYRGKGITKDEKEAIRWYMLAAKQGHAEAQSELGWHYEVEENYISAFKWYKLAAEQGHVQAQRDLGISYWRGVGVTQDYIRAHMWYNIAASQGNMKAVEDRDDLAKKMTPTQVEKAQELARKCVANNFKDC